MALEAGYTIGVTFAVITTPTTTKIRYLEYSLLIKLNSNSVKKNYIHGSFKFF